MKLFYETPDKRAKLYLGDARQLPVEDESIDMIATSPPYWGKRDYGEDVVAVWGGEDGCEHSWDISVRRQGDKSGPHGPASDIGVKAAQDAVRRGPPTQYCSLCGAWRGQLGLEPTWQEYISHLCECAEEWWRVLKPTGNLFVNMGDTFAGSWGAYAHKGLEKRGPGLFPRLGRNPDLRPPQSAPGMIPKNKLGIPFRLRFALNDMGWVSRDDIIWYKGKEYPDGHITKVAMPESVKDRMSCSYEMLFHFAKEPKGYWFDLDAVRRAHKAESLQRDKAGYSGAFKARHTTPGEKRPHSTDNNGFLNPAGANPGDVWIIQPEPFKEKHYACWPSKLCERMIKVGCPKEVCPKCGKPRERISQPSPEYAKLLGKSWHPHLDDKVRGQSGLGLGHRQGATADYQTIGWSDCGCGEGFVPGVIVDPFFGGSYRLAKEALKLGRNVIGIDMKEEYLEMAKDISIYGEKGLSKEKARREEGVKQEMLW